MTDRFKVGDFIYVGDEKVEITAITAASFRIVRVTGWRKWWYRLTWPYHWIRYRLEGL